MSFDRLLTQIKEKQNPTVAGLDPTLDFIPDFIKQTAFHSHGQTLIGAAQAFLEFNKGLIDALYDIVPAIKPQAAYYEMLGHHGMWALEKTIAYAKEAGMFVITDGKRNDIGSTMQAYAIAHLGKITVGENSYEPFGGDALTVNGYLGTDGIAPLLEQCKEHDKGIFVLVKTSNQSSGELQDRKLEDGNTVYTAMANMCETWGADNRGAYGYSAVGAVVGATYPEQISELRKVMPHTLFLIPGYGAQGGTAKDVALAFDHNGLGGIVNSSRGIMTAWQKTGAAEADYAKAARAEAIRMKEDLMQAIEAVK